ncbi:DUF4396 domain-containing protein [Virgibacillus halophilus]|uniref:DUF4396 domain-containing protein n=1 Tax=Tigheibacillus halophilus TaxID=361280 RepID=A0ABU5C6Z6_9BACI|nr:DUF4396 domain-containing protein [Virgibacillus halophilus]
MDRLEMVSWIAILIGGMQVIAILIDLSRHPQRMMPIMNIVWPLTGLYFPIIGIAAYYKLGRDTGAPHEHMEHEDMHHHRDKPFWQSVFVSTTHCSSGCSLGDMIGAPIVFFTGFTIAGSMLLAEYAVEFVIAYVLGIAFQYYGMGFKKHSQPAKKDQECYQGGYIVFDRF